MFNHQPLSLEFLEASNVGTQSSLFEIWDRSGGILGEEIIPFYQDIVLFIAPDHDRMPAYSYAGDNSLAAKIMGKSWRDDYNAADGAKTVTKSYAKAFDGEPVLDFVSFERGAISVSYERLILPFYTCKGYPQIILYSKLIDLVDRNSHVASRQNDLTKLTLANSPVLLGLDDHPSLAHGRFAASN